MSCLASVTTRPVNTSSCLASVVTDFLAPSEDAIGEIVDLSAYPIHELDGAACRRVIAEARALWESEGAADLPGFIRADVREQLAAEVGPDAGLPTHHRLYTQPYLGKKVRSVDITELDAAHPLRRQFSTDIHAIAGDHVPRASLLRRVYDSPRVAAFFAAVIGRPRLYQYADEFQKLNVMYQHDGGGRSWHYVCRGPPRGRGTCARRVCAARRGDRTAPTLWRR